MPRFVWGASLTPEERALVRCPGPTRSTGVGSHRCTVTLPEGRACDVLYTRLGARSHRFDYAAPLFQRLWYDLAPMIAAQDVERTAQELALDAFARAQEAERERMRKAALPSGSCRASGRRQSSETMISCEAARRCGGRYSACVKFASGTLLQTGNVYDTPEEVSEQMQGGAFARIALSGEQKVVIGICNRAKRCWQEPEFLIERPFVAVIAMGEETEGEAVTTGEAAQARPDATESAMQTTPPNETAPLKETTPPKRARRRSRAKPASPEEITEEETTEENKSAA